MAILNLRTSLLLALTLTPVATVSLAADRPADVQSDQADLTASLNDDQVVGIITVANRGEVRTTRVAQLRARDPRVREFANLLVRDHLRLGAQLSRLSDNLGIQGVESMRTLLLRAEARRAVDRLQTVPRAEFDQVFLSIQVKMHRRLLLMLDRELAPAVTTPELRLFVLNLRVTVAHHLMMARALQEQVR